MRSPYGVTSDVHCHGWSQFAKVNEDGVNSRLRIILDELVRAAKLIKDRGGSLMVIAGDLFHVRGSVKPSVLNPTVATFDHICNDLGLKVVAIAGNHDLEGNDSTSLGNAMQALGAIEGFRPITEPTIMLTERLVMIPWYQDLDELRQVITDMRARIKKPEAFDLIIHAPMNGVLKGLPGEHLSPEELKEFGFRFVFVGHFHNRVSFCDGAVWSVGATSHQTWGDPGTKAGFLIVRDGEIEEHDSQAPSFVDIRSPLDIKPAKVRGNYVRINMPEYEKEDIKDAIERAEALHVAGVVALPPAKKPVLRKTSVKSGTTLEKATADHVRTEYGNDKDLQTVAADILSEARSR